MELLAVNARFPPGVGFHPTDIVLVMHYLKKKVQGKRLEPEFVAEVDIYQFHPKDLRERACLNKDLPWYFFCPPEKKFSSGDRKKRATQFGYWKATGKHRIVSYRQRTVGKVRSLVFHQGKPRKAERTDWVMHEYTLEDTELANKEISSDAFVLCKIFKKGGRGPRNGEQYGAPYNEEEWDEEKISNNAPLEPVAAQDQSASGMTDSAVINGSVSANAYPLHTPEQVYSGVVSVVDQPPTPTSGGSNVASTSKGAVPDYGEAVHKAPDAIPKAAADITPSSKSFVPIGFDGMCCADEFGGIYENLEDLDGIELDDLLTPLDS